MQNKPIPDHLTSQGLSDTILKRFFSGIEYTDTCWIWKRHLRKDGYAELRRGGIRFGMPPRITVHRISWLIHFGSIPEHLFVCHECDNRRCVNPAHLWIGTHQDNMDDMVNKGRSKVYTGWSSGEKSSTAKLTLEQVRQIRSEYIPRKKTLKQLSQKYGVHLSRIGAIIQRTTWMDE